MELQGFFARASEFRHAIALSELGSFALGPLGALFAQSRVLLRLITEGGYMANLKGLESVVSQLRLERTNLVNQLRHVDAALSVLGKLDAGSSYTKPRRRKLSAVARRKIAAAQRARWAKVRQMKKAA
jgi:hypothetical protein